MGLRNNEVRVAIGRNCAILLHHATWFSILMTKLLSFRGATIELSEIGYLLYSNG